MNLNIHGYLDTGSAVAQWLSGRVLDSRPKGRGFEPHRRHCVVSLSKNINPSLVLVQPRKTRPFITERLLMGCKESNQTNNIHGYIEYCLYYVLFGFCVTVEPRLQLVPISVDFTRDWNIAYHLAKQ